MSTAVSLNNNSCKFESITVINPKGTVFLLSLSLKHHTYFHMVQRIFNILTQPYLLKDLYQKFRRLCFLLDVVLCLQTGTKAGDPCGVPGRVMCWGCSPPQLQEISCKLGKHTFLERLQPLKCVTRNRGTYKTPGSSAALLMLGLIHDWALCSC